MTQTQTSQVCNFCGLDGQLYSTTSAAICPDCTQIAAKARDDIRAQVQDNATAPQGQSCDFCGQSNPLIAGETAKICFTCIDTAQS